MKYFICSMKKFTSITVTKLRKVYLMTNKLTLKQIIKVE